MFGGEPGADCAAVQWALPRPRRLVSPVGGTGRDRGRGTNPEQLFAAGFAACFHGTLSLVARQAALDPGAIAVAATVGLGPVPGGDGGYVLRVDLVVKWPGIAPEIAAPLLEMAHALCPCARMVSHGAPATLAPAP
ncbi:OsmC family protein [Streptomyces shenzhenensis]|uniref:OsmC family protein n=1 Tax=Streptomyces shenzhenensis TaxID=943815 RepID=UPI003D91AE93